MKRFIAIALCIAVLCGLLVNLSMHTTAAPNRPRVYNSHVFADWPTPEPSSAANVYLKAAPGNSVIQMFDSMFDSAKVIRTFPAGYPCAFVGGPWKTVQFGVTMSFYKLTCDNTSGYVNAKWVGR